MKHFPLNKSTLFVALFLGILVYGLNTLASFTAPAGAYPANTTGPIDISATTQAKAGDLSVYTFLDRGTADLEQDAVVKGVIQGGNPGDNTTKVAVGTNMLVTGELTAKNFLTSGTIKHSDNGLIPVCGDAKGNVVLCGPVVVTPPTDLCDNISGVQAQLGQDITIDNPSQPKVCTQVIRGTITSGQYGNISRNTSNNAELGNAFITNISIASVGGVATTAWPEPANPLRFRFGVCSRFNPAYSGPTPQYNNLIGNSLANGFCLDFAASFAYKADLPYPFDGISDSTAYYLPYVAYDGVTQLTWGGFPHAKGTFEGRSYEATGNRTDRPEGHTRNLWYKKGKYTDAFSNIIRPFELLVLYDVKVPTGYKLILTSPPGIPTTVKIYQ